MIKKTITYTDFDGKDRTEDFYFNLSQAELTEKELVHYKTGFGVYLQRIIDSEDGRTIIDTFKDIIKDSYGVRTDDGRSFIKTLSDYEKFSGTEAYSQLFVELVTDADKASEFINGLLPANLVAKAAEAASTPGFRPGAETLPQSRRDTIAAEQAAKTTVNQQSPPVINQQYQPPSIIMSPDRESPDWNIKNPENPDWKNPNPESPIQ